MHAPRRTISNAAGRAFTLTEVLIAMGILGIGMVMVAAVFPVALDQVRRGATWSQYATIVDSALAIIEDRYQVGRNPAVAPERPWPELPNDIYAQVNYDVQIDNPARPWGMPRYFLPIPMENLYADEDQENKKNTYSAGEVWPRQPLGMDNWSDGGAFDLDSGVPFYMVWYDTNPDLNPPPPGHPRLSSFAGYVVPQVDYGDRCWPTIPLGPPFTNNKDADFEIRNYDELDYWNFTADYEDIKREACRSRRYSWHAFCRPGPREPVITLTEWFSVNPSEQPAHDKMVLRQSIARRVHQWEFIVVVLQRDQDDLFLRQRKLVGEGQEDLPLVGDSFEADPDEYLVYPAPCVGRLPVIRPQDDFDPGPPELRTYVLAGTVLGVEPELAAALPPGQVVWLRSDGTALTVVERQPMSELPAVVADEYDNDTWAVTFTSDIANWQNKLGFLNANVDHRLTFCDPPGDPDGIDPQCEILFFAPAYKDPNLDDSFDERNFSNKSPVVWYARRTVNLSP